jgi:hypothetical protein
MRGAIVRCASVIGGLAGGVIIWICEALIWERST